MPLRYSAHTLDSTASPKYLPTEPPEAPTCGCAGGVQCSGPLGVLELCAVVHAVSLALPLGAPGSVVGLAVYDSPGWAHRAAVCEYVTAYTFLCAPCLRCYRLSLDSFSARVAMARSCARAGRASIRAGRGCSGLRASSVVSSRLAGAETEPAARRRDHPAVPCRGTPRGARGAQSEAAAALRGLSTALTPNSNTTRRAVPPPQSYTVQARSVTHGAPHDSALRLTVAQRTIWAMMQTDSHKSVHRAALRRARVTCASSWPRSTRSLPAVDQAIVESRP